MDEPRQSEANRAESASTKAPDFNAAAQPEYAKTLFFGPQGLRPGWGLAFYVIMFYLLRWWVNDWLPLLRVGALWLTMLAELASFAAAAIPALILSRVDRRPWAAYGLPARQVFRKLFWLGALWGFAGISLLLVSLYGLHAFDFGHLALHGVRILKFGAFWSLLFLLVGLFEEFFFRGYAMFTLTRGIGFWPAAAALSLFFAYLHRNNEGEQWSGLAAVVVIGLFFCLTLRRTGSLWFAVGFHAAWDWGQTFFYSVPDSGLLSPGHLLHSSFHGSAWLTGGSVGPEGSVLCFVVVGVLWIAFDRVYRDAKYFPR